MGRRVWDDDITMGLSAGTFSYGLKRRRTSMLGVENLAMPSRLLLEEEILRLFKYYLKTEQMLMLKTEISVVLFRLLLEEFLRSSTTSSLTGSMPLNPILYYPKISATETHLFSTLLSRFPFRLLQSFVCMTLNTASKLQLQTAD